MNNQRHKTNRMSFGRCLIYLLLVFVSLTMFYPIYYVLVVSLSTNTELIGKSLVLIPHGLSLESYRYVLATPDIMNIYGNTLYMIGFGLLVSMTLTIGMAYGLSKKPKGYKIITYFILIPMLFSGGMIPTYYIMRSLKLVNKLWSLILIAAFSPFYTFILRNFFSAIPDSLEEAAMIEGASTFTVLVRIVLPLSLAGLSTIALFYGVGYWNMYFSAIIYINKRELWVLQVFLKEALISSQPDILGGVASMDTNSIVKTSTRTVQMAVVIVSIIPVMMIYPFIQRYFTKGVMVGAVKG